ncbi:MAG: hypothetical protein DRJ10_13180, partial [Bacteroidetes bacterium]
ERDEYLPLSYDSPRLIAQLEIKYPDNSKQVIISDESWKIAEGAITDNSIYYGEIYDAQLEDANWYIKGFNDTNWKNAKIVHAPTGKLHAQMSPPDRIVGSIKPVSIVEISKGVYRYDFGTMFSGWIKLKVKGNKGDRIKLSFFEDNGNNYDQTDTYILKGEGIEEWEPRFTWHAFRYVEISGASNPLTIENILGQLVNTNVKQAGNFECSNQLFNTISNHFQKTQLGNMHGGVPSDCPHRERRGYTGDGQIAAQAAIYNLDMKAFYTKWLNDIADAQDSETGYVPYTAPYHSGGGGIAWGSAYIIMPWYMYLYYGDKSVLEKHYTGMKKYIHYLKNMSNKDGLIYDVKDLGEWVPPTPTEIPADFVSSAYYYYDLSLIAQIAEILGENSDNEAFNQIAKKTRTAFNKRYLNSENNSYSIGRQGANVFPLAFDLVPTEYIPAVFKTLENHIEINTKGHFDTGMMGTPYVLEVLTKYGRADLAYTLMNQRDFPSFGYNIERGATTLWETWTGNESHSHPMFGSVTAWFYQALGGINPDADNPGFKHIIIKPSIINELDFANINYSSVYGDITSKWELKNNDLKLTVSIPANTTASIYIPANKAENVSIDKAGINQIGTKNNLVHYEIPSGKYTFTSKHISGILKTPMLPAPVITPTDTTLILPDSVTVNIRQYTNDAEIRYTLNNDEPNENSQLFTKPFDIHKSTTVKAKVFKNGVEPSITMTSNIIFVDSLKNGINFNYYLGDWVKLPDFSKLPINRSGEVYNFKLDELNNLVNQFGIVFTSTLDIEQADNYTFYLNSNDGSKLYIDNKLIIENDGLHGAIEKSGTVNLSAGKHSIKVTYFQAGGGKHLQIHFSSSKNEKSRISPSILFKN